MQTLYPPDYPDRPDAPLLAFGPSFSEEISRSVIATIWRDDSEDPNDFEIRVAAGLTMLEAFHPRDHLECMLAAQGVGYHCAIMETLRRAMVPDQPELVAIKLRANASQMGRTFSNLLRDMERRQLKSLPRRPGPDDPPEDPTDESPRPKRTRAKTKAAETAAANVSEVEEPTADATGQPASMLADVPELPEDMLTRPDGSPGSLAGYLPKPRVVEYIPREPPIMIALATRPKPWRMVNAPAGTAPAAALDPGPEPPELFDHRSRMFTGDALARFTSARFDPNAPVETLLFEDEDSVVELEMISAGGDPEAEAHRQAMMAAHPEGRPVVVFRHGARSAPDEETGVEGDKKPPDD